MAAYDLGYEEERFATQVNRNFHCLICLNVLKNPVMCQRNEHCFCRGCITEHLRRNAQRCPTCAENLTVATLTDAPRMVKDYLSELPIHCDNQDRGCQEIIQLQNLGGHVAECGFKPVVCVHQGCGMTINERDRIHHESEHRKLQCHNCDEMSKLMAGMQMDLAKLQTNVTTVETKVAKVDRNMANMENNVANIDTNVANMKIGMNNIQSNMTTLNMNKVPTMQINIRKLQRNTEANFETVKSEVKELERTLNRVNDGYENLKETLLEKIEGLEKKQEDISNEVRHYISIGSKEQQGTGIVVAGGLGESSVEIYNASQRSWSLLESMPGKRFQASSFVYKKHATIAGGYCSAVAVNDMIRTNTHPKPDPSTEWKGFSAKLPGRLAGHSSVLFNDSLYITGGWNEDEDAYSDSIHEVQLQPPYAVELVGEMPEPRERHCTELFNDNIFIFGGNKTGIFRNRWNRYSQGRIQVGKWQTW